MSHGTNTISAPVSMPSDIAAVLNIAGTNLQEICQSPAINMWAKWKPIHYPQKEILSDSRRASQNYGIRNIPTWSNINKMINFWLGIDTTSTNEPDCGIQPAYWDYNKPTSYFRLSDFSNEGKTAGYLHNAEPPIGMSMYSSYTIDSSGNLRINYKQAVNTDSRAIQLGDLSYPRTLSHSVGNMYFGVVMRKSDGTTYAGTQTTTVSQIPTYGAYIDISGLTSAFNGTYTIFPFISADQFAFTSNLAQFTNGDFIALQEPEGIVVGSTATKVSITSLNAYRDTSASTRLLYQVIGLQNDTASTVTLSIVYEVKNSSDATIKTITKSGITISANGYMTYNEALDMESLSTLNSAYAVRATVTPTSGASPVSTTAVCSVTNGPSPY